MLRVAEDLNAGGIEYLKEPRQSQTGTADLGGRDHDAVKMIGNIDLFQAKFLTELGKGDGINVLHGATSWYRLERFYYTILFSGNKGGENIFLRIFTKFSLFLRGIFHASPLPVLTFAEKCGII
jgi:hypothetical protein